MPDIKEGELEKRAEDIKAIRELLTESSDIALIHPWAIFAWAALVAAGSIVHYELFLSSAIAVKTALTWIWLPVLILGCIAESLSWAIRLSKKALPLFNRRLGGAILSWLASMVVFTVIVIRLAQVSLTPGIVVLFAALPLVFYAQLSYGSLFIETFAGIAVGLLFEFAGAMGAGLYLAAGLVSAAIYAAAGLHIFLIERKRRG